MNIEWFSKLRFEQLKYLYRKCEDIWNYRAQLTNEQKLGIVHNGKLFTIPVLAVNRMRRHKDKELRNILLTEFNRAVTEGTNDANRRLGAILMLTGFAEVSPDVINFVSLVITIFLNYLSLLILFASIILFKHNNNNNNKWILTLKKHLNLSRKRRLKIQLDIRR